MCVQNNFWNRRCRGWTNIQRASLISQVSCSRAITTKYRRGQNVTGTGDKLSVATFCRHCGRAIKEPSQSHHLLCTQRHAGLLLLALWQVLFCAIRAYRPLGRHCSIKTACLLDSRSTLVTIGTCTGISITHNSASYAEDIRHLVQVTSHYSLNT